MNILTANDCSPEFVELQVASFRKYLQEEFTFTVFVGDQHICKTPDKAREVMEICRRLGVTVREIPRDPEIEALWLKLAPGYTLFQGDGRFCRGIGGDSFNYMLQWIWQRYLPGQSGSFCFLHSDVFLIEPIRLSDYLEGYALAAVLQRKLSYQQLTRSGIPVGTGNTGEFDAATEHETLLYPWEALMLLQPQELPGMETMIWWPLFVEGTWTDTGGPTHYYFKAHPEIQIREIGQSGEQDDPSVDFHPSRYAFFHLGEKKILHYYSGSRWCTNHPLYWNFSAEQSEEYHRKKLAWTRKLINL